MFFTQWWWRPVWKKKEISCPLLFVTSAKNLYFERNTCSSIYFLWHPIFVQAKKKVNTSRAKRLLLEVKNRIVRECVQIYLTPFPEWTRYHFHISWGKWRSSLFVSIESIVDDTFSHNEEQNTMLGILIWSVKYTAVIKNYFIVPCIFIS